MKLQDQKLTKSSPNHRVDKNLSQSSRISDVSNLLLTSAPLSLPQILDTINNFGQIGGLSENELNLFRQQVLSLKFENSNFQPQHSQANMLYQKDMLTPDESISTSPNKLFGLHNQCESGINNGMCDYFIIIIFFETVLMYIFPFFSA